MEKINTMIKSFTSLTTTPMLTATLTKCGKTSFDILMSKYKATIQVDSYQESFARANAIVRAMCPDKFYQHTAPFRQQSLRQFVEPGAEYFITNIPGHLLKITSIEKDHDNAREYVITITIYGKDPYKLRKALIKAIDTKDPNEIRIRFDYNRVMPIKNDKDYSDVIMDHSKKEAFINGIKTWWNSRQWYSNNCLVHKLGILLYGKPGTGKSSLLKAISKSFGNAPIIAVNANVAFDALMSSIVYERSRGQETLIIAIEDIDLLFAYNREDKNEDAGLIAQPRIDCQQLFNIIDGLMSTEGLIFVATTNYIDRLDPALIRPGRFDLAVEFDYFEKDLATEFVNKFGYDESILDELDVSYPVQPALLQSKIMAYRASH